MSIEASGDSNMMTGAQLRAARALLGIDQKTLAEMAGVSVPTVQRMEASGGTVRGVIESLTRIVEALDRAGVELIAEGAVSSAGGRGVRLKTPALMRPSPEHDGSADGSL
jgi:transcriptional regulator with XRE-family HTH domain